MNNLAARKEIATRTAITLFILILLGYLFMDYNNRAAQYNNLLVEHDRVAAQKLVRQQTEVALNTQIGYATSVSAVREYAYKNREAQLGDVPVVVVNPLAQTPTPVPAVLPTMVETSHLGSWLSLFLNPPESTSP
jgi:hypothetical protein